MPQPRGGIDIFSVNLAYVRYATLGKNEQLFYGSNKAFYTIKSMKIEITNLLISDIFMLGIKMG